MRIAIFVSSIMLVVLGAAALPLSAPAEADGRIAAHDAYGR